MDQFYSVLLSIWDGSKSAFALLGVAGISFGTVVATAFGLFKVLGEKWLNQKFATQLEAFKSEQSRELEKLRHRINAVFDRTKRLHDREFEVLPNVWAKLVEAKAWASGYLSPFQQYPDLDQMPSADLEEFVEGTRFSAAQKREIINSRKKLDAYIKIHNLYRHNDVLKHLQEASLELSKHGVFVLPELRNEMKTLIDIIHKAVIEHQMNHEIDIGPRLKEGSERLKHEGEPLFNKIEESIAKRLWDSTTTEV
ncbi:hypothetical protein HQ945_05420 [Phyllobacterium sp. BT25]|uniref:Uncharacterized protein n=1 Tax=Phyllobacterium pellucidum TaxID=2740464 RepID=A0A849VMR8_9HYPH|nr:hypothetical protein [Phyllobacterium pellucidum]NTS30686.1 hypothetical protein [Phyllobacterium pellucidum]